jgi:hypothetical protein
MKHQDKGIDPIVGFARSNELVQEDADKPVITSKGERLLQELKYSSSTPTQAAAGGD